MGNRQNCAKFQENSFRNNEIISIFLPSTFSQTAYSDFSTGISGISDMVRLRTGMDRITRKDLE